MTKKLRKSEIVEEFLKNKVAVVLRLSNSDNLINVVEAIARGGAKSIELTMTMPNAIKMISEIDKEFGNDILLGVGSVLNAEIAEKTVQAGAKFVVSPIFKKEIISKCHQLNVPAIAGAFSPTEIQTAFVSGADIVKVFPADVLGMNYFNSILAPMPHLKLMPSGGVSLTNAHEWINAGACTVGIGSALLDPKAISENNFNLLFENAKNLISNLNRK